MTFICTLEKKSKSGANVYWLQTEMVIIDEDNHVVDKDS